MQPHEAANPGWERLYPKLRSMVDTEGILIVGHQDDTQAIAIGQVLFEDNQRVLEVFKAIRSHHHVECSRNRARLGMNELALGMAKARLLDRAGREIQTRYMAVGKGASERHDPFSKRTTPIQDRQGIGLQVGLFAGRKACDEGLHEIAGLITASVTLPLRFKVAVPPLA